MVVVVFVIQVARNVKWGAKLVTAAFQSIDLVHAQRGSSVLSIGLVIPKVAVTKK